jgi:hypothetical protein
MEDADLTDGNLLSDEIKINLHMLCALMLNGIGGEVHRGGGPADYRTQYSNSEVREDV